VGPPPLRRRPMPAISIPVRPPKPATMRVGFLHHDAYSVFQKMTWILTFRRPPDIKGSSLAYHDERLAVTRGVMSCLQNAAHRSQLQWHRRSRRKLATTEISSTALHTSRKSAAREQPDIVCIQMRLLVGITCP